VRKIPKRFKGVGCAIGSFCQQCNQYQNEGLDLNINILTVNYSTHKWKFNTSHIRYGNIAQLFNLADTIHSDEFFSGKIVSACSIRYNFSPGISIILGAEHISMYTPIKLKIRTTLITEYLSTPQTSPSLDTMEAIIF